MKKVFFVVSVFMSYLALSQSNTKNEVLDTITPRELGEVMVSAVKVKQNSPVTHANLLKEQIKKNNKTYQIPVLLSTMPSVVSYGEDGMGVGATYLFVRGSDAYRTNVTINGIPYNDPESQGVFWYNLSDFASSAENMQLQRGVGTSTNGAGAFGASLNIQTDGIQDKAKVETNSFWGSYNTVKNVAKFSTGRLSERWEVSGRYSKIDSDGYRKRSKSDLESYFLQTAYDWNNTMFKLIFFGGKEKTRLTYLGIDKDMLEKDRRHNPAGLHQDKGQDLYYDNETDNYTQYHTQLHWGQKWSSRFSSNTALHHTKGKGYWEQYESGWIDPRIIRYMMDNDFYGLTYSSVYVADKTDVNFGFSANRYDGQHLDRVLWNSKGGDYNALEGDVEWGYKTEHSQYVKAMWKGIEKLDLFVDLQHRYVHYKNKTYDVNEGMSFFNPKAGVSYKIGDRDNAYFSFGKSSKEPTRGDYKGAKKIGSKVKAEHLLDFELGWRHTGGDFRLDVNTYYMKYKDQLVLVGINDDKGYPIRKNVGKSYRMGLEVDGVWMVSDKFDWRANFALSKNKNKNYKQQDENGAVVEYGDTQISFSPCFVAGNNLTYKPIDNATISLVSKYVGSQYMSNANEKESELGAYFVNNLLLGYDIYPQKAFKRISLSAMINNIFNKKYVASGTFDGSALYYPQATANFLLGVGFEI